MKYIDNEIKSLLFELIARNTKLGWRFQKHSVTEGKDERLMFMLGFSTEKSSKVINEYGFMLDDSDQAKELISRWIKDARQPFNPNK